MGAYDELNGAAGSELPKKKHPPFVPSVEDPGQSRALKARGISDDALTAEEIAQLDRNGFLLMPSILSEDICRKLEDLVAKMEELEGENVGMDHEVEPNVVRVGNLVAKDSEGVCRDLTLNKKILSAVSHIFRGRSFLLDSLTSRRVLPGGGLQPLHRDLNIYDMRAANCMVALTPFRANNGATRIVPGTHLKRLPPHKGIPGGMAEWTRKHPDEILLVAPRGTVIVNNPQRGTQAPETTRTRKGSGCTLPSTRTSPATCSRRARSRGAWLKGTIPRKSVRC